MKSDNERPAVLRRRKFFIICGRREPRYRNVLSQETTRPIVTVDGSSKVGWMDARCESPCEKGALLRFGGYVGEAEEEAELMAMMRAT